MVNFLLFKNKREQLLSSDRIYNNFGFCLKNMGRIFSFSDDNKLLALVDQAGVLTIWDTATNALKQKYSPNFHLMGQCTTLTWVLTTQSGKKVSDFYRKSRILFSILFAQIYRNMARRKTPLYIWYWALVRVNYIYTHMSKVK